MAYQLVLTAVVALAAVGHAGVVAPGVLGAPGLIGGPGLLGGGYLGAPGLVNPGLAYGHGPIAVAAPAIAKVAVADDYDPNPQYSYSYNIQDALTGDNKGQSETRSGDVVQGQYNLVEPDGTRRVVDYTADPVNGFNAVVRREPLAVAAKAVVPAAIGVPAYGGYGHVGVPAYGGYGHVGVGVPAYGGYGSVGVPAYGGYGVAKAIAPVGVARPYGAYPGILG